MKQDLSGLALAALTATGALYCAGPVAAQVAGGTTSVAAKAEALMLQLSQAKGDVKARIEDRMKRVKSAHHIRSAKLSQAWTLTKEALAV